MMTKKEYLELLQRCARDGTMPGYENGECCYRTWDGRKCAIGCAIPDDVYEDADECLGIKEMVEGKYRPHLPAELSLWDLREIQNAHDTLADSGNWLPERFVNIIRGLPCFADVREEVPL